MLPQEQVYERIGEIWKLSPKIATKQKSIMIQRIGLPKGDPLKPPFPFFFPFPLFIGQFAAQ